MMVRGMLFAGVLAAIAAVATGGQVVSALRRVRIGDRPRPALRTAAAVDADEFKECVRRLRKEPGGILLLRTLLDYLERAGDRSTGKGGRNICRWEPEYRSFVSGSPLALHCLLAAGFSRQETDARGTPYLAMRRVPPQTQRLLIAICQSELAAAERELTDELRGRSGSANAEEPTMDILATTEPRATPPSSPSLADAAASERRRGRAPRRAAPAPPPTKDAAATGDEESSTGQGGAERPMIEQLQSMISGLITELERQTSSTNGTVQTPPNTTESGRQQPESPSRAPVHFRVYRSPGFPGIPGMGMPFMPGGGGGDGDEEGEVAQLERRLRSASLPTEAEEVAQRELKRLRRMSPMHSEYSTLIDYLEWIADLPWNRSATERLSVSLAKKQLDDDHYAMQKVKQRILEFLAVCQLRGDTKGSIMCMLGPPGIGKTSLGKSIASALGRDFYRVSLGGVHSEAEVRGHRRTYVGALPGLILQAVKKCGTNNAVIMLDEIDKLGRNSLNGDPSSALLEVLDPEQNQAFRDHFLSLPFNLSRVLFIATANELDGIPRPLRDRMELIEMNGYTVEEKVEIAKRHLLPKQHSLHGLEPQQLQLDEPLLDVLISGYTREAGVRELDRQIAALCRSAAAKAVEQKEGAASASEGEDTAASASASADDGSDAGLEMTMDDLVAVLGPPKFDAERDVAQRLTRPGTAIGLAWMPFGGEVLFVEAEVMSGKGQVQLTGQLGDVMQESAKAALSWIRAHATELGLVQNSTEPLLSKTDVHIHFPAGAIAKDGPSAGVTITTAMVSALTGRLVRADTAMTGEVTLRGTVLPVGGIKEKVIAAHRAGIRRIIMPEKNKKDVRDLPQAVQDELHFIFASEVQQVLDAALAVAARAEDPGSSAGEHRNDGDDIQDWHVTPPESLSEGKGRKRSNGKRLPHEDGDSPAEPVVPAVASSR